MILNNASSKQIMRKIEIKKNQNNNEIISIIKKIDMKIIETK